MAIMNFGGVDENVVTREEFPLEKAREILKDETNRIRRTRPRTKYELAGQRIQCHRRTKKRLEDMG